MITCKEDFYKYYVDVNDSQSFGEYCKLAEKFGVEFYNRKSAAFSLEKGYEFISSDIPHQRGRLFWCSEERLKEHHGKIKFSVCRHKEVYEKVDCSIFDLKGEFERGELYRIYATNVDPMYGVIETEFTLIQAMDRGNVYRKVTKTIEWWEDASEYVNKTTKDSSATGFSDDGEVLHVRASMTRDQWCDFARILLEQRE